MKTFAVSAATTVLTAIVLSPLAWVVQRAFVDTQGGVSLAAFDRLFAAGFSWALFISLAVALIATLVGVGLAAGAAFALARQKFAGRELGLRFLLFSQLFPGVLASVPLYLMLDALGLLGSLTGLVLVYSSVSVPFSTWMLLGYFEQLPRELDEAARLDGATPWQSFWRVHLPLVRPGLAITALYAFMNAWNEYVLAATFLSQPRTFTAPILLRQLVGAFSTDWGAFAAGSILVSLPVMAVFFILQKQLVSGLTAGSVKG